MDTMGFLISTSVAGQFRCSTGCTIYVHMCDIQEIALLGFPSEIFKTLDTASQNSSEVGMVKERVLGRNHHD